MKDKWWDEVALGGPEDVIHGRSHIQRGIRDYRTWSEWMVLKYGESIREKLSTIYGEATRQASAVDAMEQDSRESLGPSVWEPLEAAAWSSEAVRENAMSRLRIAYGDLSAWHSERLALTVGGIALLMVKVTLAEMPLAESIRNKCRNAATPQQSLEAANEAVLAALDCRFAARRNRDDGAWRRWDAISEAADEMTYAAVWASGGSIRAGWALECAARAMARAAAAARTWGADPDGVLCKACEIWILAADWAEGHVEKTQHRER